MIDQFLTIAQAVELIRKLGGTITEDGLRKNVQNKTIPALFWKGYMLKPADVEHFATHRPPKGPKRKLKEQA